MKIGFIGGILGLIFGGMANVAFANDTRELITIKPGPMDKIIYNYGPTLGRSVITTPLRNAAGELVGECHTLFYGFLTEQQVEGFSCTKK